MNKNILTNKKSELFKPRVPVIVFSLFFSWLLAVSFEGQVLYAVADYYGTLAHSFVFGAMLAHFFGLLMGGFLVKNMKVAKDIVLFSIAFCIIATGVFFFPPSSLWTVALISSSFLVGVCVAAWGYYFKNCSSKEERIKTIADGLIFSNLLMILLTAFAIYISAQMGLILSILILIGAFLFALRLPKQQIITTPLVKVVNKNGSLAFLCLFIVLITINSGLMYQVVIPQFAHLKLLTSLYWLVPYIGALVIMRNLPQKINRSYILYVAIAMIGFSFILFLLLGRSWLEYIIINTLLLGACGIYDLFWWSILGDMLEHYKNPAKIIGLGLSSNVLGVILGGLIGNIMSMISGDIQYHTLLALGIVCFTTIMLPILNNKLTKVLKNHIYLSSFSETSTKDYTERIKEIFKTEKLTAKEIKVTLLLIQGKTYKDISGEINVSENTVKSHVKNIYSKTGVRNKMELSNLILK